eukprot:1156081-Pelagomonas_calceolata.AAC.12
MVSMQACLGHPPTQSKPSNVHVRGKVPKLPYCACERRPLTFHASLLVSPIRDLDAQPTTRGKPPDWRAGGQQPYLLGLAF